METRTHETIELPTNVYVATWSEDYHDKVEGTFEEILELFSDLNPDEEDWFMWIYEPLALADYVTGGGVTLREFEIDAEVLDKVECDNMTIMRVS